MIDRAARRDAMAIAAEKQPSYPTQEKAMLYGLIAKSLDLSALKDVRLPLAESLTVLKTSATEALTAIAVEGYNSLPRYERQEAEDLLVRRDPRARILSQAFGGLAVYGIRRMKLGVMTAANAETITLRTIAHRTAEDKDAEVTERGLQLSGRVPLALALLHLYDLNDAKNYYEPWQSPQKDAGDILVPTAATLDPEDGLRLQVHPEFKDEGARRSHGPQIGCPASMVQGYIYEIHRIVSEAALASGLITAA